MPLHPLKVKVHEGKCHACQNRKKGMSKIGMGIVNRFHSGTGSESNDSLELLTKTLYDSLSIFLGCAATVNKGTLLANLRRRHTHKLVTCNTRKRDLCAKGGNTTNMSKHLATQHGIILQQCCVSDTLSSISDSTGTAGKIKQLANVV